MARGAGISASRRMARARSWLTESDKPVAAIAMDLGYSYQSTFSRAFARETGMSPVSFR